MFVTNNVEKKVPDDLIAVPKPPPDVIDLALNDLCLDFHNEGADAWPPAPPPRPARPVPVLLKAGNTKVCHKPYCLAIGFLGLWV